MTGEANFIFWRRNFDGKNKPVVEVDFAQLSDGALVEMIEDPADVTKTLFAVYCNQSVSYAPSIEEGDRTLLPISRADHDLRHVSLAQGAEAYGQIPRPRTNCNESDHRMP